jgi:polysaccharide export outer membrane protein
MIKNVTVGLIILCGLFFTSLIIEADEPIITAYTVGIGDVLDIRVLQPEQLKTSITVVPDGSITFPYIGNVQVKGMTLAYIQDHIQARLGDGYMKYPVVSISLEQSRSRKFFISGDVTRPDTYPIKENTTVLKAISIAGGFAGYGPSCQVKVLRQNKDNLVSETIKIDVKEIMNGNSRQDLLIQPGDMIEVSAGKFFVSGDVRGSGRYLIEENTTVLKAISIAGGFACYGPSCQVKVVRQNKDTLWSETIKVDVKEIMNGKSRQDLLIQPGDTIEVSAGKFSVYGEVAGPGTYPIEENTTILRAIAIAGGFREGGSSYGSSGRVKILRPKKDTAGFEIIEIKIKDVINGSSDTDILLLPGDIIVISVGFF